MQTRWSSAGRSPLWALVALASILPLAGCRPPPRRRRSPRPAIPTASCMRPCTAPRDPTLATAVGLGLVQLDPASGRITGELARSWRHNRGFTRYRFRLRQGLATAVAARLTAVRLPGLASATAAGARTVSIRLAAPDPGCVAYLGQPGHLASLRRALPDRSSIGQHHHARAKPRVRGAGPADPAGEPARLPGRRRRRRLRRFPRGRLDYALVPPGQISLAQSDPKLARGLISQPRLELVAVGIGPLAPGLRRAVALATPASAASADVGPGSSIARRRADPPGAGAVPAGRLALWLRPGGGEALRREPPSQAAAGLSR